MTTETVVSRRYLHISGFNLLVLIVFVAMPSSCYCWSVSRQSTNLYGRHVECKQSPLPLREVNGALGSEQEVVNGWNISETAQFAAAPQVTYDKFLTMQEKRVVVTIRYTGDSGLKPYFLTAASKLKSSHPDVLIEKQILPAVESSSQAEAAFEILVDGKVVVGAGRNRERNVFGGRVDLSSRTRSVFVSMQEVDLAISRARRRRRPTTVYGENQDKNPAKD